MLFLNDAKHLILGTGQLKVGDTCVGLLKGDVSFDHEPKKGEVKGGFPQVTVKSYKEEETAVLSASLAEISKDNIELFLGQLGGGGGDFPILNNVTFTHQRDNDETIILHLYKATAVSGFKVKFTETGLALMDLQIEAIADVTKPSGKQLYEITFGDSATGVTVTPATASIAVDGTQQLSAAVAPATASQTVTWTSSDTEVATVSASGLVTGIAQGTATITATASESITDTCAVTVTA
ncbi:MAG: Ig-like domain-containing protein [Synergistales bacterium]|nr:Ig-like domain-containing protein [Synergistales bacterium]